MGDILGLCGDNGKENKTQTIMGYIGSGLTGVPENIDVKVYRRSPEDPKHMW